MRVNQSNIVITIVCVMLLSSCTKTKNEYVIRVDMRKEHDAGRFNPEQGDKICIAGPWNEWNKEHDSLTNSNGTWIYTIAADRFIKNNHDTVEFKLILRPGVGREVINQGWENVPIRKIPASAFLKKNTIFVFSEIFDSRETFNITFHVGINNQKVLGFFRPEDGDTVAVCGSFCAWSQDGVPMKDENGSGIYSVTLPVRQNPSVPLIFKYRILHRRKAILPNQGWETMPNRQWMVTDSTMDIPSVEFNNIKRVARFIIDTKQWEQNGSFNRKRGDVLRIKLLLDGKESLSDGLFQVDNHVYETALIIPLSVKDVRWQVVKNVNEEMTPLKAVTVDVNGTKITL